MEWSDDVIARLKALWTEGLSTAEIGRRLGVSKNAVVGKAHRLSLTARPSPIRREGNPTQRRNAPRRVKGPTLPPLGESPFVGAPAIPAAPIRRAGTAAAPVTAPVAPSITPTGTSSGLIAPPPSAPVEPRIRPVVTPRSYGRLVACCWPIGEPGTKNFRFCDAESLPGKPYCEEHAQVAYVKVRDRREEAA